MVSAIEVYLANRQVGALSFDEEKKLGYFEYTRDFAASGIDLSPIHMSPYSKTRIFSFPALNPETFKGLPGLIADSLPDDFGNAVMNAWVARRGRQPESITPLERLQYTGTRGMGALEYRPIISQSGLNASAKLEISELIQMAQAVVDARENFQTVLEPNGANSQDEMLALLSVGMSAGGARPKAVLALNDDFTQVRSGQVNAPEGFTHYLMKFDGVHSSDRVSQTFGDPMGFGAMEYVYYLMATQCGIDMMPSHLLPEGDRRHFITQRFDRIGNEKVHVQTLNGIAHIDYKKPGAYSYEELFGVARKLKLPIDDAKQLVRRMVFNVVARNHDDHSKNFAFKMTPDHKWRLAPAYDLAYSYKPGSFWVNKHWMSLNGKRDDFTLKDILSFKEISSAFGHSMLKSITEEVIDSVSRWPSLAKEHDVPAPLISEVGKHLSLKL